MNWITDRLERATLRTLLLVGSLSGLIVALLMGFYGLRSVWVLEARVEQMHQQELMTLSYVKEANINMLRMSRNMRHMLIAPDEATRARAKASVMRAREQLLADLTEGRSRVTDPQSLQRYEAFERDLSALLESIEEAVGLIEQEPYSTSTAARFITSPEFGVIVTRANDGLHELANMALRSSNASLAFSKQTADETRLTAWVLLAVGVLGSLAVSFVIGSSIQRPNERLRRSVEELAAGRVDTRIPHTDYPNEVGTFGRAIQVLQGIYRQSNDQTWVKSSAAELAGLLQQSDDTVEMAQLAVSHLTPLVGGAHGAFYVLDEEAAQLRLLGTYGLKERQTLANAFRLGEGVVGQCAMERNAIILSTPESHLRIVTGTGAGRPATVMVVPLMHRDKVWGVLEVASLDTMSDRARALIESTSEMLGMNLAILQRNQRRQAQEATAPVAQVA